MQKYIYMETNFVMKVLEITGYPIRTYEYMNLVSLMNVWIQEM